MISIREKFGAKLRSLPIHGFEGSSASDYGPAPMPVCEDEIVAFEAAIGTRLPDSYRQFLLEIGSACFGATCVWPIETCYGDREHFNTSYGGREEETNGLWWNRAMFADRITEPLIPIGGDGYGDQFCLAVTGRDCGKIFFWCMGEGKNYLAADSFDDFLNRLGPDPGTWPAVLCE